MSYVVSEEIGLKHIQAWGAALAEYIVCYTTL